MKRFALREFLLLTAPLALVGAGYLVVKTGNSSSTWNPLAPAKPEILDCSVRSPTPLEVFKGAQIGVTVLAHASMKPFSCPGIRYELLQPKPKPRVAWRDSKPGPGTVWFEQRARVEGKYTELQETYAYGWFNSKPIPKHLVTHVKLRSSCGAFLPLERKFELPTEGIAAVDINAARRANFQVTSAQLVYMKPSPSGRTYQEIRLSVKDVENRGGGLMTVPRTVGNWTWTNGKSQPVEAWIGLWSSARSRDAEGTVTSVTVTLETERLKVPPRPGTKISGLVSIAQGWPQKITIEWPEKLNSNFAVNEVEFSAELAPVQTF